MVKETNLHEIQEGKYIPREEKNKEPSQGKETIRTDLIRCRSQKQGSKEPRQTLTARGAAKAPLGAQGHPTPGAGQQAQTLSGQAPPHSCDALLATSFPVPSAAQEDKLYTPREA